jgi:hypothetical protein
VMMSLGTVGGIGTMPGGGQQSGGVCAMYIDTTGNELPYRNTMSLIACLS